ncbi:PREDICTED: epsin-3 [Nelumbo nucifera]|uniref:Epsin-3 n=2 Tax=Nelumbo nucifera TaxID=4432 RepID=A0A1U7ZN70_NELNU|nr:PREDICTED: epsin-3 [Nelumbo nucifera]DAD25847.1 TPA_asm: hypothetical protein HUJ06_027315 [Nelumbo nucifera]
MSILGNNNSTMGTPFFHEFKKHASFFLKEKIRTARLALTDVTPAQLLTEEATNGDPWAPDTRTMGLISRAAFEVDDYWRIVDILHTRLSRFDRKNWRIAYKAVILLEHLLTHGPESVAEEFQSDKNVIGEMETFQYIDEKGFNWGLAVRRKSERVLKLLDKGPLLKEERNQARKLTRGIEGFGSFCQRSSSADGSFKGSYLSRSNSIYCNPGNQDDQFSSSKEADLTQNAKKTQSTYEDCNVVLDNPTKDSSSCNVSNQGRRLDKYDDEISSKENIAPTKQMEDLLVEELEDQDNTRESKPLLGGQMDELKIEYSVEKDHPFNHTENQITASLLFTRDEILQGC